MKKIILVLFAIIPVFAFSQRIGVVSGSGGGTGDNWGTDAVVSDVTLTGDGTAANILKVDTTVIATIHALADSLTTLTGDNLGNHIATQILDMATFGIYNTDTIANSNDYVYLGGAGTAGMRSTLGGSTVLFGMDSDNSDNKISYSNSVTDGTNSVAEQSRIQTTSADLEHVVVFGTTIAGVSMDATATDAQRITTLTSPTGTAEIDMVSNTITNKIDMQASDGTRFGGIMITDTSVWFQHDGGSYEFPNTNASGVLTNDGSGNLTWAVGGSESTTVTDSVNGLDITLTGADIRIDYDFSELTAFPGEVLDAQNDRLLVWNASDASHYWIPKDSLGSAPTAIEGLQVVNDDVVLGHSATGTSPADITTDRFLHMQDATNVIFEDATGNVIFEIDETQGELTTVEIKNGTLIGDNGFAVVSSDAATPTRAQTLSISTDVADMRMTDLATGNTSGLRIREGTTPEFVLQTNIIGDQAIGISAFENNGTYFLYDNTLNTDTRVYDLDSEEMSMRFLYDVTDGNNTAENAIHLNEQGLHFEFRSESGIPSGGSDPTKAKEMHFDSIGLVVGANTHDASAILEATSTTQGFLMPRMTTAQRTAIAAPADGLQVYDTDLNCVYFADAGAWSSLCGGAASAYKFSIADGTTTEVIDSGNVVTFADGGLGVDLAVKATDTITADLDILELGTTTVEDALNDYAVIYDADLGEERKIIIDSLLPGVGPASNGLMVENDTIKIGNPAPGGGDADFTRASYLRVTNENRLTFESDVDTDVMVVDSSFVSFGADLNDFAIGTDAEAAVIGQFAVQDLVGSSYIGGVAMLPVNATGAGNTTYGNTSATALTTGANNTIMGGNTGNSLSTGSGNVLVGQGAGDSSADFDEAVVIGRNAGTNNVVDSVVVIGSSAGQSNAAIGNVFIGGNAGAVHTTGDSVVILGYDAETLNPTDGNVTLLGAYAENNAENQVALGNANTTTIRMGDGYTIPAEDGNADEVLITDGTGVVSWGVPKTATTFNITAAGATSARNQDGSGNLVYYVDCTAGSHTINLREVTLPIPKEGSWIVVKRIGANPANTVTIVPQTNDIIESSLDVGANAAKQLTGDGESIKMYYEASSGDYIIAD